jgi:hypothetical protein
MGCWSVPITQLSVTSPQVELDRRFHGLNMGIARKVTITVVGLLVLAELYLVFRPEPDILTAGVASGEAPVTDALQKRFPVGSPASALEAELKREGVWGPVIIERMGTKGRLYHYVQLSRRVGLFTPEVTTIAWEVGPDGLLANVRGSKYADLPVP